MLVLSRKPGEELVIGDNIRLTVVAIHGSQVRLGITAPIEMSVRRQEPNQNWPHPAANSAVHETSS
jgi:carbon storage regulator